MNEQLPTKGDSFCKSPVSCSGCLGFFMFFSMEEFFSMFSVLKTPTLSDVLALFVYAYCGRGSHQCMLFDS